MKTVFFVLLSFWLGMVPQFGRAHALDPGYLDLNELAPGTWRILWRIPDVNGQPMEIDAVLPDHCAPANGPEPTAENQAWVSSWIAECDAEIAGHVVAIDGLERQQNDVLLRVRPLNTEPVTLRFTPDEAELMVPAEPTIWSVFSSYFLLGFEHILGGWDHLLFVFALFVLVRNPWRLVGAITAFTVAHSLTLAMATLGFLNVPAGPVEAVIALSIVFLALEILRHKEGDLRLSEQYPWIVCFSFGLLHGLGFAGALAEIGLPSQEIPAALLAFNIGVEAGQLAFIAVLALLIAMWRLIAPRNAGWVTHLATPVTGYAIGCISLYWLIERVNGF
ncbi:HupE/UreJ family protein [Ruegeria arenilitoris]|uniref:HupE/UreJ family protein n=1 Tax=Ruegeria arenilitoris TaxID=1173585 RepID=UPI0034642F86